MPSGGDHGGAGRPSSPARLDSTGRSAFTRAKKQVISELQIIVDDYHSWLSVASEAAKEGNVRVALSLLELTRKLIGELNEPEMGAFGSLRKQWEIRQTVEVVTPITTTDNGTDWVEEESNS